MQIIHLDATNLHSTNANVVRALLGAELECAQLPALSATITLIADTGATFARVDNHGSSIGLRTRPHDSSIAGYLLSHICASQTRIEVPVHDLSLPCIRSHFLQSNQTVSVDLPPETRSLLVFLPDVLLHDTLTAPLALSSATPMPPQGAGAVLATYLCAFDQQLAALDPRARHESMLALIHLVSATFSSTPTTAGPDGEEHQSTLRRRALRYIEARLSEPQLTPARIASALRVSIRSLHAAFSDYRWSVRETILELRLLQCHAAFADPAQAHRTVSEVAFAWGFKDPSHFARAFRRRFGCSPTERRTGSAQDARCPVGACSSG